jgi:hypothetical protein
MKVSSSAISACVNAVAVIGRLHFTAMMRAAIALPIEAGIAADCAEGAVGAADAAVAASEMASIESEARMARVVVMIVSVVEWPASGI